MENLKNKIIEFALKYGIVGAILTVASTTSANAWWFGDGGGGNGSW